MAEVQCGDVLLAEKDIKIQVVCQHNTVLSVSDSSDRCIDEAESVIARFICRLSARHRHFIQQRNAFLQELPRFVALAARHVDQIADFGQHMSDCMQPFEFVEHSH